jgi:hypothetical protein
MRPAGPLRIGSGSLAPGSGRANDTDARDGVSISGMARMVADRAHRPIIRARGRSRAVIEVDAPAG